MNKFGPKMMFNKWREPVIRPSAIPHEDRYRDNGDDEWFITEDGYEFTDGDVVWSPYTYEWHKVEFPNPDVYGAFYGWFNTINPITGQRSETLNSCRMTKLNNEGKSWEEMQNV